LDTGIDLSHPAFEGHLVEPQKMWDFVDNDSDPSEVGVSRVNPSYGHGTHVAGIIALTAPDAKIMPIRILGPDGSGELWRVTAGVIWAAQHGAEVVNLSIGYPTNVRLLKDLIDCADDGISGDGTTFPEIGTQRLTIVAAAGNSGVQRDINGHLLKTYPAAERLDPMLGVGSSTRYDKLSDFSSFNDPADSGGDWVNIVAPGEDIVSAIPGGRYAMWTGTSMAAPMVSGVAALVRAEYPIEIYPTLTSSLLAARIKNSAFQIQRYDDPLRGFQVRFGRLDALSAVSGPPPAPTSPAK
jgi:subtilisin family serine protease